MDGIHDLGGKSGFGRVNHVGEEPVFKARWHAKVFAMVNAAARAGAYQSVDQFRHAVERIHSEAYLSHGYYGRWLGGVETLLVEAGLLSTVEISRRALKLGADNDDLVAAQPQASMPKEGGIPAGPELEQPKFSLGDRVRSSNLTPVGHTRLPCYARDKTGEITALHDRWPYPDAQAHGIDAPPQFLYTVTFDSAALGFPESFALNLDLFEPYLTIVESD